MFAENTKDNLKVTGGMFIGGGLLALSLSLVYVANGVFTRFDRVEAMTNKVEVMTKNLDQTAQRIEATEAKIKTDMTTFREQFPQIGGEAGQAGAAAVDSFKQKMREKAGLTPK